MSQNDKLMYAPDEFRNDINVILAAIHNNTELTQNKHGTVVGKIYLGSNNSSTTNCIIPKGPCTTPVPKFKLG